MKIFLKFIIFFILSNRLYAGSIIDQYIFSSANIINLNETKQLFNKHQFEKNYFNKVRLSADFSEFSNIESEYAIRVYPKSLSEIDIEQSTYKIRKQQVENQFHIKNLKNLKLKYNMVLEAYYQKEKLENIKSFMELYNKEVQNLQLYIQNSSDVEDLSNLKDKLKELELLYLQKSHQYKNILREIQSSIPNINIEDIENELKNNTILSSKKIVKLIAKNNHQVSSNMYTKDNIYKTKILHNKATLEKLKNQITLESVELKYDDSKKINKNLSIGINVEIPIGNGKSYDHISTKLKLLSLQNKTATNKLNIKHKISKLIEDIKFLYKFSNSIESHYLEKQDFYHIYIKSEKLNSKFLLNLKKKILEFDKNLIKIEYQLHKKYLELLYLTDKLDVNRTKNQIFNHKGS